MRGKDEFANGGRSKSGITPAYAGKSCLHTLHCLYLSGSPPPMRGKGQTISCKMVVDRITPAYAGKSS